MEQQDFFLNIAMTKHPISGELSEVEPREAVNTVIEEGDSFSRWEEVVVPGRKTAKERLLEFDCELAELRRQYQPFLENHLPPLPQTKTEQQLDTFSFRYLQEGEVFTDRDREELSWETVTIPDYRGPGGAQGRWSAWYRTKFHVKQPDAEHRVVLQFQAVDYIAVVYVNGCYVGSHEGFFAPFSMDITPYLKKKRNRQTEESAAPGERLMQQDAGIAKEQVTFEEEENELIIECRNDVSILGVGNLVDGDKIYAATGPGWDDPETGWHHCPAGAGILGTVTLETRPCLYVEDIYVRTDIDAGICELRVGVRSYLRETVEDYELEARLLPRNFAGAFLAVVTEPVFSIGVGKNEYRFRIPVSEFRLWEPETPWLYGAQLQLKKEGRLISAAQETFGFKQFLCDETSKPKGKFYLNHRPIVLRGANEMGHLQQCVMTGNFDQLVDDILIAKLCHMNYYRVTQRPVQREIYDYFDMLGMMHQCDLPLFSYLRRPQFAEAIRQTVEMEHLIRSHVSSILVTLINEPVCIRQTENPEDKYSKRYRYKGHRELLRDELEAFFAAARKAIYTENPDRVVKNVEGDYDPPTAEGLPDFHCYTMWYTNHGQPIGRLRKGYLPPLKDGWMVGCGEYGAEGLEREELMLARYPKEWLTCDHEGNWYPDRILAAQTHSVQGDWYPEQHRMSDWVRESQAHQALATMMMTDAFRRRADRINHTAIHLLIDAWPSGWMKTLVDCERVPKPAYFAYRDALEPLRVHLYCDRKYLYEGETVSVSVWLLNDTSERLRGQIHARLVCEGRTLAVWQQEAECEAAWSVQTGVLRLKVPEFCFENKEKQKALPDWRELTLEACLEQDDRLQNVEELKFRMYPRLQEAGVAQRSVGVIGERAAAYAKELGLQPEALSPEKPLCEWLDALWISDWSEECSRQAEFWLSKGKTVVWFVPEMSQKQTCLQLGGHSITIAPCQSVFFAAQPEDQPDAMLKFLYDRNTDTMEPVGERVILCEEGEELAYTYAKSGFTGNCGAKPHLPFVKRLAVGEGRLYLITLQLEGKLGVNANLDHWLRGLLDWEE